MSKPATNDCVPYALDKLPDLMTLNSRRHPGTAASLKPECGMTDINGMPKPYV